MGGMGFGFERFRGRGEGVLCGESEVRKWEVERDAAMGGGMMRRDMCGVLERKGGFYVKFEDRFFKPGNLGRRRLIL